MAALARDFGVSEPTVWRALRGPGEPEAADMGGVAADVAESVPAPATASGPAKLSRRPTG